MEHWTFNDYLLALAISVVCLLAAIAVFVWATVAEKRAKQKAELNKPYLHQQSAVINTDFIERRKAAEQRLNRKLKDASKDRDSIPDAGVQSLAQDKTDSGAAEFAAGVGAVLLYEALTDTPAAATEPEPVADTADDDSDDSDSDGGDSGD